MYLYNMDLARRNAIIAGNLLETYFNDSCFSGTDSVGAGFPL